MNVYRIMENFIARRLYKNEQGSRKVSRPAVVIAQAGVALGLAVMLVTIAVSLGFKYEVRAKAVGFSSHLHVSDFDGGQAFRRVGEVLRCRRRCGGSFACDYERHFRCKRT